MATGVPEIFGGSLAVSCKIIYPVPCCVAIAVDQVEMIGSHSSPLLPPTQNQLHKDRESKPFPIYFH